MLFSPNSSSGKYSANNAEGVHSKEVQEIMCRTPNWLIRSGGIVILLITFAFAVFSWHIKYPDTITSDILITTRIPPTIIVARSTGMLHTLLVENNEDVKENDILAVIESASDHQQVFELKSQLNHLDITSANYDSFQKIPAFNKSSLGELQSGYETFARAYNDFFNITNRDVYNTRTTAQQNQINEYINMLENTNKQMEIQKIDVELAQKRLQANTRAYDEGILSLFDLENAKSMHLQKLLSLENTRSSSVQQNIQLMQLHQSLDELTWQYHEDRERLRLQLNESVKNLLSQIEQWEHRYIVKSPLTGKVSFIKYWTDNQNINAGESLFKISPENEEEIIGISWLPGEGYGKVVVGQHVDISLVNYPSNEYGRISGTIYKISSTPSERSYLIEIILPNGLKTDYHKVLPFSQELHGTVNIMTNDIRLIWRFLNPIRNLFNKYT